MVPGQLHIMYDTHPSTPQPHWIRSTTAEHPAGQIELVHVILVRDLLPPELLCILELMFQRNHQVCEMAFF